MKVKTTARDCLYLNWALPVEGLAPPPAPLRYEVHRVGSERVVLLTALFFRHQGLQLAGFPWLRLTYPQLNLRLCVVDRDGTPAVLFRRMMVPLWVWPGVRLAARHPVSIARLDLPRPELGDISEGGAAADSEAGWVWRGEGAEGALRVHAWPSSPASGSGPDLGSWERTVDYFRQRRRGYSWSRDGLRKVEASHPAVAVWPMAARVEDSAMLEACFGRRPWPSLHSAFLCPEIPFIFELAAPQIPALAPVPARVGAADPAILRDHRPGRTAA
jgi:hypothetical protein